MSIIPGYRYLVAEDDAARGVLGVGVAGVVDPCAGGEVDGGAVGFGEAEGVEEEFVLVVVSDDEGAGSAEALGHLEVEGEEELGRDDDVEGATPVEDGDFVADEGLLGVGVDGGADDLDGDVTAGFLVDVVAQVGCPVREVEREDFLLDDEAGMERLEVGVGVGHQLVEQVVELGGELLGLLHQTVWPCAVGLLRRRPLLRQRCFSREQVHQVMARHQRRGAVASRELHRGLR
jgi:hypothetical protein